MMMAIHPQMTNLKSLQNQVNRLKIVKRSKTVDLMTIKKGKQIEQRNIFIQFDLLIKRIPFRYSGWIGGIFNKLSFKPKNQMILPDDKDPAVSMNRVEIAKLKNSNDC